MVRGNFLFFILLISFSLLIGCTDQAADDCESWVNFSHFQKAFDEISDDAAFAFTPWQTNQQVNDNTIHSTVLWCDDQSQHVLEITANSNGNILNITLQSEKEDYCSSCFAEASYQIFCSMGFMEKSAKGHTVFTGVDAFNDYFQFFSDNDIENSMWINRHEVTYTHLSDSKTYCFMIRYNT